MALDLQLQVEERETSPSLAELAGRVLGRSDEPLPPSQADLSLTITFSGEQEIEIPGGKRLGLPGGRASFGIRRGRLQLTLQDCTLPLKDTGLANPFGSVINLSL